jgi:small subunit ribosomal protein S2
VEGQERTFQMATKKQTKKLEVSAEDLLSAGAHFGHQVRRWNPKMGEYLYGQDQGIHIFDLIKTKANLELALEKISESVNLGKNILLVACKKQARDKALEIAKETGIAVVTERWLGGTITNFPQIKKSIDKLFEMKKNLSSGFYAKYTKKERILIEREIERLERFFGGISNLTQIPDLLIVVDIRKETTAIREAKRKGVTTIGIVDSNSDPNMVDYPIPMNDDATKALNLVLDYIKQALLAGRISNIGRTSKNKTDEN